MATEEEKNNQQELNQLLREENQLLKKRLESQSESLDLSSSLVDSIKGVLGINSKRSTSDQLVLKVNKEINTQISNQRVGIGSIESKLKDITKNDEKIRKGKTQELSLEKQILENGEGRRKQRMGFVNSAAKISGQLDDEIKKQDALLEAAGKGEIIDQNALKSSNERIGSLSGELDDRLKFLSTNEKQLLFTKLNIAELERQNAEREKELALAEELQEKLGVAGKLNKLIGTIPGLGGAASKALKEVTEELERAAEAGEELPSKAKVAGMQFKALGKNLVKDLVDPTTLALGAVTAIGKALMSVDKEAGEFAKNMGISYDESLALRSEMSKVSRNNKDILVTSKALVETQQSLNQFFGTTVQFSDKLASDLSILSKRTNMTAETQGLLALETAKTGKSALQLTKELNLQTFELNNQKGVQMSVKQIQDAIGKTAASLQLTFKGSSKELANQVVSARALGTNLAGVEKISSALLDFESSIQSELQAELLLGKNINLEKAREAALRGDMGKVAEEVMKNTAIMNAFEEKNVIKQEAAAKSLGLSRDELANMVLEQQKLETIRDFGAKNLNEAQNKYNDLRERGLTVEQAAAQVGDEALANQLQTASVAARFEAIMLRVQEIFIGFAGPILGIVEGIMTSVGGAEHLANILIGIAGIYGGIRTFQIVSAALDRRKIKNEQKLLALKTGQAAAASVINPVAAIAGLAVAGLAAAAIYSSMNDGMIGPDGGMIVTGEKGSIQLNKQDSIITGTDLLGGGNNTTTNTTTTTTSEVDNSEMITLLKNQNTILQKIAAKSSTIEMNGNQVGQEINTSERAIQ